MTVTTINPNGYYAEYDANDEVKPVIKLGYSLNPISTIRSVIVPDPLLTAVLGSAFSSFLMTMYKAGLHIAGKGGNLDLTKVMERADVISDFDDVKVLDVMSLMGAVNYDVSPHIPDGQGGETPRPSVAEVMATAPGDPTLFIQTIKYLGLSGWTKYVYGERGMSFEHFCGLWFYFYPTLEQRKAAYADVNVFLRDKGVIFSADHIDVLLNAETHTV